MDTIYRMTVAESAEIMNASINGFKDSQPTFLDDCEPIIYGVNKCLALRDYLLGLPLTMVLSDSHFYVEALLNQAIGSDKAPFLTILAFFAYEDGDKELALQYLGDDLVADYSLARLLRMGINKGWHPSTFNDMRVENHPHVLVQISEIADMLLSDLD